MTMQSGAIASRFRAVSSRVSPFVTLDVETLTFTASADRRLAAISNEVLVRVDDSKKRLITVRPRSAGTFLISRLETSRKLSAVSSRWVISPASSSRMPSRWRRLKVASMFSDIKKAARGRFVKPCLTAARRLPRLLPRWHELADVIRLDRQLAMFFATIDQHSELHATRATKVDQLIECGANRAT